VVKEVRPGSGHVGDRLEFTITVGNRGTMTAQNVVATDTLPDYLDLLGVTADRGTVLIEGQTFSVDIGSLAPNELVTIHVASRINGRGAPTVGSNTAIVTTSTTSDDPSNNTSTVTFVIIRENGPVIMPPPELIPPELPRTGAGESSSVPVLPVLALILVLAGYMVRRRAGR
jgi:uncharacterized repeat protein (TIGR01451 family)